MKTSAAVLLLSALALTAPAQVPPPPATPVPAPGADSNPALLAIAPSARRAAAPADEATLYGKDELNLKEVDINQFLTLYAEVVGRTILRPATLPAPTITLRNMTPITRTEAIQLFDAVLGLNGIAVINVGEKFAKVLPVAEANTGGARVYEGRAEELPELGSYVTHVVQLKYVKPSEMVQILQPFARIPNSILPIEGNGILVIRDYSENVKRMLEMIERVDVTVPAEFVSEVIPIKYALAGDIASALNSLGGGGSTASVGSGGGGASAAGSRTATRGGGSRLGGGLGGAGYGQPGTLGQPGVGGAVGGLGQPGAAGGAGGGTFTERLRSIISRASQPGGGSGDIQIFGQTKIIADERTNSLLIYATRQDMEVIKDVISKLDVVLAQVLIESIILGVSGDKNLEYGVAAAQKPTKIGNNAQGAGIVNNDRGSLLENLNSLFASNAVASLGGLNYFGKINDDWLVAVKALSSSGKTEVIQRPTIMTTHATPGRFFVGNTVPYITSTYNYGGFGGGPSSSYSQLRVGIQLDVTPFINPDGIVVMKIDQAIEEIDGFTKISGDDVPKTASRTLSADITVRDRETIVLGGFIRTLGSKTKEGIPLLKDIPLLGGLFRNTSDKNERRELLVLMRPTVLRTPELAARGSDIERERMTGINKFTQKLDKENAEFERKMDELDGGRSRPNGTNAATASGIPLLQPAPAPDGEPPAAPRDFKTSQPMTEEELRHFRATAK